MKLRMIGPGRMGGNMVRRLLHEGYELVVFDPSPDAVAAVAVVDVLPARDLRSTTGGGRGSRSPGARGSGCRTAPRKLRSGSGSRPT